jgi:hypothetical protein
MDIYLKELALREPLKFEPLRTIKIKIDTKNKSVNYQQSFLPTELINKNDIIDIFAENEIIIKNSDIIDVKGLRDEALSLSTLYNQFVAENKGFEACTYEDGDIWIRSLFSNKIHLFDIQLEKWLIHMREIDPYDIQGVLYNLLVNKINVILFKNGIKNIINVKSVKKFTSLNVESYRTVREINIVMTYIVSQIMNQYPNVKNEIQTKIIKSIELNRDDTEMINKRVEELREKSKNEKMNQYHEDREIRKMQKQLDEFGLSLEKAGAWTTPVDITQEKGEDGDEEPYIGENPDYDDD